MRLSLTCGLAALGLLLAVAPAQAQSYDATVNCTGALTGHIDWPADNPLWSFDYVRPSRSSGIDGSGLEILNVHYRGRLVLRRAHTPVLNVEYDGGCGCYRDWADSEAGFAVTNIRPEPDDCFADADAGTVETTCDINLGGGQGGDAGTFRGVAVEDYGDELVVTSHMSAGWYRYRIKWHFYADGRIWPEFSFSAASAICTSNDHRHHAYWRFDFDILTGQPGDGEDQIYHVNPALDTVTRLTQESQGTWGDPADGVFWAVRDAAARAGYVIRPSSADLELPIDSFSKVDYLAVRYVPGNYDDGSNGCAINPNVSQLDNNESLVGQDVVFWYRSGALHLGGNPWECDIVGPTLIPFRRDRVPEGAADEPTVEDFLVNAPFDAASASLPEGYELERAQPNPFNPSTTVRFRVAEAQRVSLALYDALGRRVATLHEGYAE
ncbi:MAG: hypothetical protein R3181_15860, partial [Rubricoccaceae bacterium]|nr:hypothetical protein [Rubricoccaceae bacterium]